MLTGSLPFQGENRKATMTMILKWAPVQPGREGREEGMEEGMEEGREGGREASVTMILKWAPVQPIHHTYCDPPTHARTRDVICAHIPYPRVYPHCKYMHDPSYISTCTRTRTHQGKAGDATVSLSWSTVAAACAVQEEPSEQTGARREGHREHKSPCLLQRHQLGGMCYPSS